MLSAEEINNFPQEWLERYEKNEIELTEHDVKVLKQDGLKHDDGMIFGRMYSAWKTWKIGEKKTQE